MEKLTMGSSLEIPMIRRQKDKFRFHLLGLVHLPVSEKYMGCAFTQKIVKMSKMLLALGHEVYLYGAEGSDAPCTEFIQTHTLSDIRKEWGDGDNRFEIGYDWTTSQFRHDINVNGSTELWKRFNAKVIRSINKRKRPDDFLVVMQGNYQKPIADAVDLYLTIEPGIGYRGSIAKLASGKSVWRGFESTFIQNFTYGSQHPYESINGSNYDMIIPNYFDPKDFEVGRGKGDYYLYVGRLVPRKGISIAINTCRIIGKKLVLAGQPDETDSVKIDFPHCEYVGYVGPEERTKLMKDAIATFVPTQYLEPFAGTHVESMLCGTPVITTTFGVFTDTVIQGVNGFRCSTLNDNVQAAELVKKLDRKGVRASAEQYLMPNIQDKLEKWFRDLYQVYLSTDGVTPGWDYIEKL